MVNDGQDGRVCPQGYPSWNQERNLFTQAYLRNPNNLTSFTNVPAPGINTSATLLRQRDSRATEDCLFLDVLVPTGVYGNASVNATGGVPVIVWIFGGGFYEGSAESQGNPAGLLTRSVADAAPGVVYVAINYRLGGLGFMAGPTFSASGGLQNAGFYDQRFALEWIQVNMIVIF